MPVIEIVDPADWGPVDAAIAEHRDVRLDRLHLHQRRRPVLAPLPRAPGRLRRAREHVHRRGRLGDCAPHACAGLPARDRAGRLPRRGARRRLRGARRPRSASRADSSRRGGPRGASGGAAGDGVRRRRRRRSTAPCPARPTPRSSSGCATHSSTSLPSRPVRSPRAFLDAVSSSGLDAGETHARNDRREHRADHDRGARRLGIEPDVEAAESTMGALVDAVVAYYAGDAEPPA